MKKLHFIALFFFLGQGCTSDADKICEIATKISADTTLNALEKSERFAKEIASFSSTPVQNIQKVMTAAAPENHAEMWQAGLKEIKGGDFACPAMETLFPSSTKATPKKSPPPREASKSTEVFDPTAPQGSLDKKVIQDVIRKAKAKTTYCYERELAKNPKLAGKLTVSFVIGRSGAVVQAMLKEGGSLQNNAVGSCLVRTIEQLQFPKPKGDGIVKVSYPFVFKVK